MAKQNQNPDSLIGDSPGIGEIEMELDPSPKRVRPGKTGDTNNMTKTKPGRAAPRKMPSGRAWDADDRQMWRDMYKLSPGALRKWGITNYKDYRDLYRQLQETRRLRQEESEFYQRELAAAKQANLGRIQSNLLQTLQSMMATMEGNSRAVHALAVPVGDLLEQLGKELREGKVQQK